MEECRAKKGGQHRTSSTEPKPTTRHVVVSYAREREREQETDRDTGCRRFTLDRSLLRLSPEEVEFFKTETDIETEPALLDHIHQVASDAYQVTRLQQSSLVRVTQGLVVEALSVPLHTVVHVHSVSVAVA